MFHVSKLKLFHGNEKEPYLLLPLTAAENNPIIQPLEVLHARTILQGSIKIPQLLIQWDNTYMEEATWEIMADFHHN